jgi:hypothetical protein
MPTSGNPDWTQTVGQLCLSAALELGVVGLGDSLDDSEQSEMMTRLNSMLAKWSIDANLFREDVATVTVGTTGVLALDSDVRDIRSARFVQSATNKRWIAPWNRDQFFALPNRAQTGASPMAFYLGRATTGLTLNVWPVPTANISLELDINRGFYFASGPEQEFDLPREWHEAALYGLAARCANMFGATKLDPGAVQRIETQARTTYEKMLDHDRPDSYFFEYDSPVEVR